MKLFCKYFLLFILGFTQNSDLFAQEHPDFQPVIGQIGDLENRKDPKCHATASRLEDFIYGTPLSFEARSQRIAFQKDYVKTLWLDFTKQKNNLKEAADDLTLFKETEKKYFEYKTDDQGIHLLFQNKNKLLIPERDYRQYSSIAYALRAILSVQQSFLFEKETLASLNKEVMAYFKKSVGLAVLALLHESDQMARADGKFEIEEQHINVATKKLYNNLKPVHPNLTKVKLVDQKDLLYKIIDQKQTAYQAYNQISQAVFLRNVQVYFAKVLWPTEPEQTKALTNFYTEVMAQYTQDLLAHAEASARQQGKQTIEYKEVYEAVQAYLPHTINLFEDVTYFPNFDRSEQIVIEAYDLDAFRDSGLHWQYLKYALDDRQSALNVAPDPFALELLVEGVAQFAVVVFRMAGANTKEQGESRMNMQHLTNALTAFQQKLSTHPQTQKSSAIRNSIVSGKSPDTESTGTAFSEVTTKFGVDFQHRNSDWLGRALRSYVLKEDEGLARLSIPPAFGGGGVAAEDFDKDGWVDVLLLGGRGNRLYKNNKGKQLVDVTKESGINWKRPDGNYGEPRQPIIIDFDNDGWQDIFISYVNDQHRLFRNKGDGTFEDVSTQANLGGLEMVAGPATSIDYDKDGLPDLYIGYFGNYLKGELPTLKRHNTNGDKNRLFRNLGNFKFEEVSEGSGLQNAGWTQAVGHSDINGDGWQDLIVGNDFGVNAYYLNNQDGTFTDASKNIGTDKPSYTMNIGISDLNNDMFPDFYISNIVVMEKDDKYVMPNEDTKAHFDPSSLASMRVVEANDLFISSNDEGGVTFSKSTAIGRGFSATGWSWDADFFDYDNDGDDDLYCLTGMNQYSVYGTSNEYYSNPEGDSKEVTYAASNAEANVLFENTNGALEVKNNSGGLDFSGTSRSAAFFDMDNDGDQDIIVNDYQGQARLFRNNAEQSSNNWVAIKLVGNPDEGITKDAIGAALILSTPNGTKKWKEVYSTTGYLSVHPKLVHFGLGDAKACDVEIRWPNGHVQKLQNLELNTSHKIRYEK